MRETKSTNLRRSFLKSTISLAASPAIFRASRAFAKSDSVTIVNYGGAAQEAHQRAVLDPFTKETGIRVSVVPYPGFDKVKAMQLTRNVTIDIDYVTGAEAAVGSKLGLWQNLDHSLFDLQDLVIQPARDYVTFDVWSRGVTWDPKKFGPQMHPRNFTEFWDLHRFPGKRVLRSVGQLTLEVALLGDGVPPDKLYPLDLDRAFKVLDRIKSQIVWAATTPQDTSLLQVGQADFAIANSSRVKNSVDPGGGVPLAYSFEQNLNGGQCFAILNGAPNPENAMKLIAFYMRADVQARLENINFLLPVSQKARTMLSPEVRRWLPDLNNPNSAYVNDSYWSNNFDLVARRFQEWRIS